MSNPRYHILPDEIFLIVSVAIWRRAQSLGPAVYLTTVNDVKLRLTQKRLWVYFETSEVEYVLLEDRRLWEIAISQEDKKEKKQARSRDQKVLKWLTK